MEMFVDPMSNREEEEKTQQRKENDIDQQAQESNIPVVDATVPLSQYNALQAQFSILEDYFTKLQDTYNKSLKLKLQENSTKLLNDLESTIKNQKDGMNNMALSKINELKQTAAQESQNAENIIDMDAIKKHMNTGVNDVLALQEEIALKTDESLLLTRKLEDIVRHKNELELKYNSTINELERVQTAFDQSKTTFEEHKASMRSKYETLDNKYKQICVKLDNIEETYQKAIKQQTDELKMRFENQVALAVQKLPINNNNNIPTKDDVVGKGMASVETGLNISNEIAQSSSEAMTKQCDEMILNLNHQVTTIITLKQENNQLKRKVNQVKSTLQSKINENIESLELVNQVKQNYEDKYHQILNDVESLKCESIKNTKKMLHSQLNSVTNQVLNKIEKLATDDTSKMVLENIDNMKNEIESIATTYGIAADAIESIVDSKSAMQYAKNLTNLRQTVSRSIFAMKDDIEEEIDQEIRKIKKHFSVKENLQYIIKYLPNLALCITLYQLVLSGLAVLFSDYDDDCNLIQIITRWCAFGLFTIFYMLLEVAFATETNVIKLKQIESGLNLNLKELSSQQDSSLHKQLTLVSENVINIASTVSLLTHSFEMMEFGNWMRVLYSTFIWVCACEAFFDSELIFCAVGNEDATKISNFIASGVVIIAAVCMKTIGNKAWSWEHTFDSIEDRINNLKTDIEESVNKAFKGVMNASQQVITTSPSISIGNTTPTTDRENTPDIGAFRSSYSKHSKPVD